MYGPAARGVTSGLRHRGTSAIWPCARHAPCRRREDGSRGYSETMNTTDRRATVLDSVREVAVRRDLLRILVWRELKVRYKQSVLGILWAVVLPLLIVSAGVLVRVVFSTINAAPLDRNVLGSLAVRAVPWAFIIGAVRLAANSLVANAPLLTKVYVPRLLFPLAAVLSQVVDLLIALIPVTILVVLVGATPSVHLLWVPVLLVILICLPTAFGIMASAAAVFFRDVKYLVEIILMFAIFFTPVLYEVSALGEFQSVMMLNPVAPLLEGLTDVVMYQRPPSVVWILYSAGCAVLSLLLALHLFRKAEPWLAEIL